MKDSANSSVDISTITFKNAMPGFYYVFCFIVQLLFTGYLAWVAFASFSTTRELPSVLFVLMILVSIALVLISVNAIQKRVQSAYLTPGGLHIQTALGSHDLPLSECKQFQSNGNLSDYELITNDKTYQFNDERSKNIDFIQQLEMQLADGGENNEYVTKYLEARIALSVVLTVCVIYGLCVIRDDFIWAALGLAVLDLSMCLSFSRLIRKATIQGNVLLITTLTGAVIKVDLAKTGAFRLANSERQFEITVDGKRTFVAGITMPDGAGLYRRLNQFASR